MAKPPQILQLNPSSEIVFKGPFDKIVTSYLTLNNPSESKVCFKIKTTAPRRYCVRPNHGFVEAEKSVRIAIMLQPVDEESEAERSRHKFMVQSTIVKDSSMGIDDIWSRTPPNKIMDSKLRCVFQQSESSSMPDTTTTQVRDQCEPAALQKNETRQASERRVDGSTGASISTDSRPTETSKTPSKVNWSQQAAGTARSESTQKRSGPTTFDANKSVSSSQNLTASYLQPMGDSDYRIILLCFVLLIVGVILGKYII